MEILFTIPAREDLKEIKKYICNDDFQAAQKVIKHIIECIEMLKNNPSMGHAGRVLRTRELVITKYPYIVPYQIKDDIIYILRVLHTSQKYNVNKLL